ncbi:MAG TPA: DNA translocase FtsK 4TM domain-containing protein [Phycisphaerae bacterium]|nr:DNA translocase FtsK 4TM domain-containing protein [Phycisphaerae bacterium]HRR83510.1 DNA translocase FtsK 4TM domain-containing protein [Phycisphaerae bacterium]
MNKFQQRLQIIRGCLILLVLISCLFLWVSVLSFSPLDAPNPRVYPHPAQAYNAGGKAGAWVAYKMFSYFGKGAYAAAAGLTMTIIVLAWKGCLPSLWQRIIGVSLLISVTSAVSHMLLASPDRFREETGGILGYCLATWLQQSVNWMAWPMLFYGAVVGLLFTAEELVLQIPAMLCRRRQQVTEMASAVAPAAQRITSITGPFRRAVARVKGLWPRPAPAGAPTGGRSYAPVIVRPRPAVAKPKPAPSKSAPEDRSEQQSEGDDEPDEAEAKVEKTASAVAIEEKDNETAPPEAGDQDEPLLPAPVATKPPPMVVNFPTPPKPAAVPQTIVPPKPYPAELGEWTFPPLSALIDPEYSFTSQQEALVREKAQDLQRALHEYGIEAHVVTIDTGPVITMFELQVAPGVKLSQITSLANDIARALYAPSVRVVAPIPGRNTIGIEVPNLNKEKVRLKELMTMGGDAVRRMALPLFLGKDASGRALIGDLAGMPHMLIAGTTGSGKSVCINSIIMSILMTQRPDMVKLILVDPKMVEMSTFRDVPHLMCPIVTEIERAEKILSWATEKMDERYALLAEAGVRNIAAYNKLSEQEKLERFQPSTEEEKTQIPKHLPYVVIIVDELADMMMMSAKEVEAHLARLAQKSRAVGIHIIVATQRPEAKIVTGLIKSNLPCRIAFRVASRMDSRIVLDQNGAEVLMGQGDMLYLPPGSSKLVRAQGTFLEDSEVREIINFLRERSKPEFHPELMQLGKAEASADGPRDELFDQAVEIILETGRGSVSLLQRRLAIGYSRASRLIEEMAAAGIVGEYTGSQARKVLITAEEWQVRKEQEATRIRQAALQDDGVPDMLYDDDID